MSRNQAVTRANSFDLFLKSSKERSISKFDQKLNHANRKPSTKSKKRQARNPVNMASRNEQKRF